MTKISSASIRLVLFLFMCNGSSPVDAALLKGDNCSRVKIDGEDYWNICFKQKKTNRPVTCLLKGSTFFLKSSWVRFC